MAQTKVLIVEDEANARAGLAELVTSWGYRTETAADGAAGLEMVQALVTRSRGHRPDDALAWTACNCSIASANLRNPWQLSW